MLIGASMSKEVIPSYKGYFPGNHIMRIFPNGDPKTEIVLGGSKCKVPPPWTDERFKYCEGLKTGPHGHVIPFISSKGNGTDAFVTYIRSMFINMPGWIKQIYYCDWHEPEADFGSGTTAGIDKYKDQQEKLWKMLQELGKTHPTLRAKIKFGPVLTKQWTEDTGDKKGNFKYQKYDPGFGDFLGIDAYVLSNTDGDVVNPSTMPTPVEFLKHIKAYKLDASDTRPRVFPELGLIGMPADTSGTVRANWLQGVHNELKTWRVGAAGWTQPWSFAGWLWWNTSGKATGEVPQIGQARDFPLHLRSVPKPAKTWYETKTRTDGTTYTVTHWISEPVVIPGNPPPAVATFNAIWAAENSGATPDPDPTPDPTPDPGPIGPYPGGNKLYLVGATMAKGEIANYESRLSANRFMRIFPNSDGLPPSWTDPRFAYLQRVGGIPFISSNIDGNASKFPALVAHLNNMPPTMGLLYISDRHEPENNMSAATYLANYRAWWTEVILKLKPEVRSRVRAGPILTRQYIEDPSKGDGNFAEYDPGLSYSDFYAIDMYMDSWKPGGGDVVATAYKDPAAFLAGLKGYRLNASDVRPRIIAELGAIGIPTDPAGTARAAWIQGVFAQLDTWKQADQGWPFHGAIWWNAVGSSGKALSPIGTARYFFLDKYQDSTGALKTYPGTVPAPLAAYNQVALAHTGAPDPDPDPDPPPDPPPGPTDPTDPTDPAPVVPPPVTELPAGGLPVDGPEAARLLRADYTILVTDANLNVLGDPIADWTSLQATIRWKEPGSGQINVPAHRYIREQLVPGCRIVVLRKLLGTQHILLSGPLEKKIRERSDDGENGGVGTMVISFVEDLAWLGARLAFPKPQLNIDAQDTDYWVYAGDPEAAMLELVNKQAGPGALPQRRVPKLRVANYSGVAGTGTVALGPTSNVAPRERLEKLTDVLRKICVQGANPIDPEQSDDTTTVYSKTHHPDSLGFRTRQTRIAGEDVILFEPVRSRDLSREVHFSFSRGNLKYYSYEEEAPSLTHPIVGGSGEGADRKLYELPTLDEEQLSWGRFEGYVSRPGTDPLVELQKAAVEELADKGVTARLASNAADTVDQRYGIHYNVGDVVSVQLDIDEYAIAPVQTVNLQAWPTAGEVVGTTIGDQGARYDSAWIQRMRDFERRLGRKERE